MAEKGSSEGSVYFNKQRNRWNAQYYEYNPQTDKTCKKTKSFKSEEEAKKYIQSIMYQKENSLFIEHNGIPLCEFMKSNLKIKLDTEQIKPTQFGRVMRTIEQIEKMPIGRKNIDIITAEELQSNINYYKNLSKSSITKIYQLYNQTFKNAFNKGYITRNPMVNVIKPKSLKKTKKVRALTVNEQQQFTNWLLNKNIDNCRYKNVFLIQMYMGLRVGEVLALTQNDIDLKNKKIRIHRTLTTDENNAIIMGETTKTEAGKRVLTLPDYLYPHIIEQMKFAENQEHNKEKLLFKPENQNYTRRANVNSELKRILKTNFNIEDISTHSLRHTYCTRCIEAGIEPMVIASFLGQSDIEMVYGVYTDIQERFRTNELTKINKYYMNENLIPNNILSLDNEEKEI